MTDVVSDLAAADSEMRAASVPTIQPSMSASAAINAWFKWGIITAATQVSSYYAWNYTVAPNRKTAVGRGADKWTANGDSLTNVINPYEDKNPTTEDATSGNLSGGVDYADLKAEGAYDIAPIAVGTPVLIMKISDAVADGSGFRPEWAIVGAPNQVTGDCGT